MGDWAMSIIRTKPCLSPAHQLAAFVARSFGDRRRSGITQGVVASRRTNVWRFGDGSLSLPGPPAFIEDRRVGVETVAAARPAGLAESIPDGDAPPCTGDGFTASAGADARRYSLGRPVIHRIADQTGAASFRISNPFLLCHPS